MDIWLSNDCGEKEGRWVMKLMLPPRLEAMVAGYTIVQDGLGLSPAKVYQLVGKNHTLYLKVSGKQFKGTTYDVEREKDILLWLENSVRVPEVVAFEADEQNDYLLMCAVEGVCLYERGDLEPHQVVEIYVDFLKTIQSVNTFGCPFTNDVGFRLSELDYLLEGNLAAEDDFEQDDKRFTSIKELVRYLKDNVPNEDLIFSHGDLSDGNVFVDHKGLCHYIDWGRGGLADKWQDIAFCVRSIREDLGHKKYVDLFFDLLEVEPDWKQIDYHLLLDQLF